MNKKVLLLMLAVIFILSIVLTIDTNVFHKKYKGIRIRDREHGYEKNDQKGRMKSKQNDENKIKEEIKNLAENFAEVYYSYTWGNFSNIESLYPFMTDGMLKMEKEKVKRMLNENKAKKRVYLTVEAKGERSDFIEYEKGVKASLRIKLKLKKINGAWVTGMDISRPEISTTIFVNGDGKIYNGNIEELVVKVFFKDVDIYLNKQGTEWKVDRLEVVN